MEIFLSAETEGPAASRWSELQRIFQKQLLAVREIDYGTGLCSIGIISILMREEYFEDGGYKERRYYHRGRKEADIRIRMDYNKFLKSNPEERKNIYKKHILECIRIAGEKTKGDFDTERLVADVERILI